MEFFCSLLPGSSEPLQIVDGDDVVYEEIDDYDEFVEEEIDQFPASTNGNKCINSLPQPSAEMANPLSIQVDPVSDSINLTTTIDYSKTLFKLKTFRLNIYHQWDLRG